VNEADDAGFLYWDIGKERFDFLIDGVYGISMTLLVLDLRVPEVSTASELANALAGMGMKFLMYGIAFMTVGTIWMMDMIVTRIFVRADVVHVMLNLLALMFVALVPFTSALLASYPNSAWGVAPYAADIASLSFVYGIAMSRARRSIVPKQYDHHVAREFEILIWLGAIASMIGVWIATYYPTLGLVYMQVILLTFFVVFCLVIARHRKRVSAPGHHIEDTSG